MTGCFGQTGMFRPVAVGWNDVPWSPSLLFAAYVNYVFTSVGSSKPGYGPNFNIYNANGIGDVSILFTFCWMWNDPSPYLDAFPRSSPRWGSWRIGSPTLSSGESMSIWYSLTFPLFGSLWYPIWKKHPQIILVACRHTNVIFLPVILRLFPHVVGSMCLHVCSAKAALPWWCPNWLVVWNINFSFFHILGISSSQLTFMFFEFHFSIEKNHPNWQTHIFYGGWNHRPFLARKCTFGRSSSYVLVNCWRSSVVHGEVDKQSE